MSVDPEVLLAHAAGLRALAQSMLRDEHLAEDVVQDTMAAALHRRPSASRPLQAWLATVARNFARKRLRSEKRRVRREAAAARPDSTSDTHAVVARFEEQRRVARAVAELAEPYRAAVLLRYFEGLSAREIAQRAGEPAATVRSRLKRARALLRARLDRDCRGREERAALLLAVAGQGVAMGMKKKLLGLAVVLLCIAAVFVWRANRAVDEGGARPVADRQAADAEPANAEEGRQEDRAAAGAQPAQPSFGPKHVLFRGRVRTASGDPIAGATVRLGGVTASSSADGTFAMTAPLSARRLIVEAEGYAPFVRRWNLFWRQQGADIALHRARSVPGRVVNRTGEPVEGASIAVRHGTFRTRSGRDGSFSVPMDAGGFANVSFDVVHPEYAPQQFHASRTAFVAVTLTAGRPVEGRILSADGKPVAGARVIAMAYRTQRTTSDADGRFRFAHVGGPGRNGLSMVASAPDHGLLYVPLLPFPPGRSLELRFRAGRTLSGRAFFETAQGRRPLPGGRVKMVERGNALADTLEGAPWPTVVADAEGRFTMPNAPTGFGFLALDAAWPHAGVPVPPGTEAFSADVVVVEPSTVRIKVVDPSGAPAAGVRCGLAGQTNGSAQNGGAYTDASGHATMTVVARKQPRFAVARSGVDGWFGSEIVKVRPGETHEVTVRLQPRTATAMIRGRVIDRAGRPFVGALVEASARPSAGSTYTDADGRFTVEGLKPGPHKVKVRGPGVSIYWQNGVATGEETVLTVPRGHEVRGRLVDEAGEPVGAMFVSVASDEQEWNAQTDVDGRFVALDVRTGTFRLRLGGGLAHLGDAEVAVPGEAKTYRVRRPAPGQSIRGRVLDANDKPLPAGTRVTVMASRAKPPVSRTRPCDLNGDFEIEGLPDGRYDLLVRCGPLAFKGAANVEAGADDVLIRVPRTGEIAGTVKGPEGPLAGVRVRAYPADVAVGEPRFLAKRPGPVRSGVTDAAGKFRLGFLTDAEYTLVADHPQHRVAWIRGVALDTQDAALTVETGATVRFRLLLPDGKPWAGKGGTASVMGTMGERRFVRFQDAGEIAVPGLTPGSCQAQIWTSDGYFKNAAPLKTGAKQVADVVLDKR